MHKIFGNPKRPTDPLSDDVTNLGKGVYCLNYVPYSGKTTCDTYLIKVMPSNRRNITSWINNMTTSSAPNLEGGQVLAITTACLVAFGEGFFSQRSEKPSQTKEANEKHMPKV